MSSREKIVSSISINKPALVELPFISMNEVIHYDDVVEQFKSTLESIGGKIVELNNLQQLNTIFEEEKQTEKYIINTIAELGPVAHTLSTLSAHDLALVDKAYIRGSVAVAENGSVWLYESQMINRLLPFICEHLVLVIEKKNIVATMHHAYQQIHVSLEGFGVFLAGPSKTADIEQSLVIGAHGARSLVVYLLAGT
jgi:L-lactate dehydrogenase complex protein LldG